MTSMKIKRLSLAGAATLVAALIGCVSTNIMAPPVHEVNVHIEGTVSDLSSGEPIVGALAEVRTFNTGTLFAESLTDSTGAYTLMFLYRYFEGERNFCPFIFLVSAQGYTGDTPSLQCIEEVQTIDVQLQSSASAAATLQTQ